MDKPATNDLLLIGLVGVAAYLAYRALSGVASAASGLVTGNNPITAGTPYAGAGIVATPAAIMNAASGGALASAGEASGGWLYNLLNPYAGVTAGASTLILGDGTEIPVGSVSVDAGNGTFSYNGAKYQVTSKTADDTGTLYAYQVG